MRIFVLCLKKYYVVGSFLFSEIGLVSFFLVSWGGVRLSLFGTSATVWPIVPAPNDR
jgi:hypothetical protein